MTERIIEISDSAPVLRVHNQQLILREPDAETGISTPLSEAAGIVISNPAVMMSQGFVAELAELGGILVICNRAHMPVAMMLPLNQHCTQSERILAQAQLTQPRKKQLWAQIVRAKIRAQGRLLQALHQAGEGFEFMARRVQSGDVGNLEAQAARRYWPILFQDSGFRRDRAGGDQNRLLNYGYAILRATVVRALCGVGLHPSLGLQHHHRENSFCLADDLMEPYRPLVDAVVWQWLQSHAADAELDSASKAMLIASFLARYTWQGEERSFFDWLALLASSLAQCIMGKSKILILPELSYDFDSALCLSSYVARGDV